MSDIDLDALLTAEPRETPASQTLMGRLGKVISGRKQDYMMADWPKEARTPWHVRIVAKVGDKAIIFIDDVTSITLVPLQGGGEIDVSSTVSLAGSATLGSLLAVPFGDLILSNNDMEFLQSQSELAEPKISRWDDE